MRIKALDYTRFFAVIMVILGHCLAFGNGAEYYNTYMQTNNFLHNYIYSFHMPLFAVLSGYLFSVSLEKATAKEALIKRIRALLIPILSWQVLINIYGILLKVIQGLKVDNLLISLINYRNVINNMWFLWSMLICSLLVIIINKFFEDHVIAYIFVFIITFFVEPYILQLWLWLYPFFVFAYLFGKHKKKLNKLIDLSNKNGFTLVILLIHFIMVIFWKVDYYIYIEYGQALCLLGRENLFYNLFVNIYRIIAGMSGCIGYILLVRKIIESVKASDVLNYIEKFVMKVSEYSIGIYVFSVYMLNPILRILPLEEYNLTFNILQTIVILFISMFFVWIIDKIKITRILLLGKRKL